MEEAGVVGHAGVGAKDGAGCDIAVLTNGDGAEDEVPIFDGVSHEGRGVVEAERSKPTVTRSKAPML